MNDATTNTTNTRRHAGNGPAGRWLARAAALAALALLCLPLAWAAEHDKGAGARQLFTSDSGSFQVPLYKSGTIELSQPASRISVGNPGVADILVLRGRQLYVVGKRLGATNVVVWDKEDRIVSSFDVEVVHDLDTLKRRLHDLLPGEDIKVHSAQENILLSGQVSSLSRMQSAQDLAQGFLAECIEPESDIQVRDTTSGAPTTTRQGSASGGFGGGNDCVEGKVVNLLQVGGAQQVMMEVKVAEMSRDVLKRLDSDFNIIRFDKPWKLGGVSGGATFPEALDPDGLETPIFGGLNGLDSPIGPVVDKFKPNTPGIDGKGLFFSYNSGKHFLEAAIEASRRKGLAKILAEPTLTALTGQEAEFISGGEFPIPVAQSGGDTNAITIVFKEFGVGVKFLPVVLDSGHINLKLNVSVSELSNEAAVIVGVTDTASQFTIPSLTKRAAATTVELGNGQTIGIAGLINDSTREFVDKLPGLGDVPVLGALFRSQEFQSGQTELVIFVTPHLAKPIAREDIRLPTDSFVPPSDMEFYLLGRMEGGRRTTDAPAPTGGDDNGGGADEAKFGHQL